MQHLCICCAGLLAGCGDQPENPAAHGSADVRLKPIAALPPGAVTRTVYVPVYSSIYWGLDRKHQMIDLAATVSVRNVSSRYPVIVNSVQYFDSAGKKIRDYVSGPSELAPLATVDFVIQQRDIAGGPGANFLIEWAGAPGMNEPVMEAVMIGQSGNAAVSFMSSGRVLKKESEQ